MSKKGGKVSIGILGEEYVVVISRNGEQTTIGHFASVETTNEVVHAVEGHNGETERPEPAVSSADAEEGSEPEGVAVVEETTWFEPATNDEDDDDDDDDGGDDAAGEDDDDDEGDGDGDDDDEDEDDDDDEGDGDGDGDGDDDDEDEDEDGGDDEDDDLAAIAGVSAQEHSGDVVEPDPLADLRAQFSELRSRFDAFGAQLMQAPETTGDTSTDADEHGDASHTADG